MVIKDRGFVMRPREVREQEHHKQYDGLRARLQGYLK